MMHFGNSEKAYLKDKVPYFLLLLLCFFPLMRFGLMSAAIIVFALGCILCNYGSFVSNLKRIGWRPVFFNIAFFLLLAFTAVYSENTKNASIQIEKGLPILLLPIVFLYLSPRLDRKRRDMVFAAFLLSNLLFLAYLFHYLVTYASDFHVLDRNGLVLFEGLSDKSFVSQLKDLWNGTFYEVFYYARKTKESAIQIHKTYISQNLLWCILILIYFLGKKKTVWYFKLLSIVLLAVFTISMVYLYSLINLVILLVLVPCYVFFLMGSVRHKVVFALVVSLLALGVFAKGYTSKERVKASPVDLSYAEYVQYENPVFVFKNIWRMLGTDDRNLINRCNWSLIREAPLFGHGVGDVQDSLDRCYGILGTSQKEAVTVGNQNLNTHNYYAFLWIGGGALVLLFFLIMLVFNLAIGLKNRDLLYLAFILVVLMNLLTENTLARAHGILFFALWNSFLLAKNLRQE